MESKSARMRHGPGAARGVIAGAILLMGGTSIAGAEDERGTPAVADRGVALYVYDPGGRRDPFVSLVARGTPPDSGAPRAAGPAGLRLDEFGLRGILRAGDRHIAMIQAADGRSFLLQTGDRLLNATVKDIRAEAVVFLQDGDGPLATAQAREVVRTLRPAVEER